MAKQTVAEVVVNAIKKLRKSGTYVNKAGKVVEHSKGIHLIYSGLHGALKAHFGLDNDGVRAAVDKLVVDKVIESRGARGGVMIYLPGEGPTKSDTSTASVLATLGLA